MGMSYPRRHLLFRSVASYLLTLDLILEGLMREGIVPRPVNDEEVQVIDLETGNQVSHSVPTNRIAIYDVEVEY